MSSKKRARSNGNSSLNKLAVEVRELNNERNAFTEGVLSDYKINFVPGFNSYVDFIEYLEEQGIYAWKYPYDYADPEYVDEIEEIFDEIYYSAFIDDEPPSKERIAYVKGILLGKKMKSKEIHRDFSALQDDLSEIEHLDAAYEMINSDSQYSTDCDSCCPEGNGKALALAHLKGELKATRKNSFTHEEEREILTDIDRIMDFEWTIQGLINGDISHIKR